MTTIIDHPSYHVGVVRNRLITNAETEIARILTTLDCDLAAFGTRVAVVQAVSPTAVSIVEARRDPSRKEGVG